jgi:hypothetical protein
VETFWCLVNQEVGRAVNPVWSPASVQGDNVDCMSRFCDLICVLEDAVNPARKFMAAQSWSYEVDYHDSTSILLVSDRAAPTA